MFLAPTYLLRIERLDRMIDAQIARTEYELGLVKRELDVLRKLAQQAYIDAKKTAGDA